MDDPYIRVCHNDSKCISVDRSISSTILAVLQDMGMIGLADMYIRRMFERRVKLDEIRSKKYNLNQYHESKLKL